MLKNIVDAEPFLQHDILLVLEKVDVTNTITAVFSLDIRKCKFYDKLATISCCKVSLILMYTSGGKKPLSRTERPIEAHKLLKNFLLLWKRLEILKTNWGCHRLQVPAINSTGLYKNFW